MKSKQEIETELCRLLREKNHNIMTNIKFPSIDGNREREQKIKKIQHKIAELACLLEEIEMGEA